MLFDALGTLVELEPPWPRLIELLRGRHGIEADWDEAKRAVLAEMAYYKEHHDEGADEATLAELRTRCATVLADELPALAGLSSSEVTELLLESLRFNPYPDVPGVLADLRRLGLRLAIVSNWDCSLRDTLAELGLSGLVDEIVVSAEAGARKPAPAIFERALSALGVPAEASLFIGDSPETDIAGARSAGIDALLLDRNGLVADTEGVERIFTLADLPPLVAARLA